MAKAFVLINAEIGAEEEVLNSLNSIAEVREAHVVYGVYDIITMIEADTMDELKEVVTSKIRGIERVRSTLTMIVM